MSLPLRFGVMATPRNAEQWIATARVEELKRHDSLAWLPSAPEAMRAELERRANELGPSYVIVNSVYMDAVAPILA